MNKNFTLFAAGATAASLFLGCSLSEPAPGTTTPVVGATAHVTILQTSDLHSHANGDGPMSSTATAATAGASGSYARIAAYVGSVRSAADAEHPVVLVDSGDWTMGTLYDLTLTSSPLQLANLVALNYDCTTLGNHEFDYTPAGLAKILAAGKASSLGFNVPIVASNMNLNGNADLAPFMGSTILPSYTKTLSNGLKIGFIGLMGEDAAADAPNSAPVAFSPLSQNYATVQALVNTLRTSQGCNIVVALDHVGTNSATGGYTGEDISLAQNVAGIDVIASGHTHNPFANATANHPVKNLSGSWTTQVISCGAYGSNVSRIDLVYTLASNSTTVDVTGNPPNGATNLPMVDATLASAGVSPVPEFSGLVLAADQALNAGLGPMFSVFFPTYSASNLSTGLYQTVAAAPAQDMLPNDRNAVLCPNGLGDLCADADRNVPNGIIQTVAAALVKAGWDGNPATLSAYLAGANLSGFDMTPFTAGMVPTGVIRDSLRSGSAVSFANVYDVLPLGISPDTSQADPIGYPMVSAYLTLADLQKLCALQLVGQTNLISSSDYLNLSGITYQVNAANLATFYQEVTAAAVLQVTELKAGAGSTMAATALAAVQSMATDQGAAMGAAVAANNPYAIAMMELTEATPDPANLPILGAVAAAASAGGSQLNTMLLNAAIAAVGPVSAYASSDPSCQGTATVLDGSSRYRIAANLYGVLMMGAIESQFGVTITPYAAATGSTALVATDLAGVMGNRINATPGAAALVELKEWEALLEFLTTPALSGGLGGQIGAQYASTVTFTDFGSASLYGSAVTTRNAAYGTQVLPAVGQLMTTLTALTAATE
jgi:2',3'-cyclic-nucleotide 2'-phosphodiesterase (5'-nucleotidase family)